MPDCCFNKCNIENKHNLALIDLPGCCFNQSFTPVPPSATGDSASNSARLEIMIVIFVKLVMLMMMLMLTVMMKVVRISWHKMYPRDRVGGCCRWVVAIWRSLPSSSQSLQSRLLAKVPPLLNPTPVDCCLARTDQVRLANLLSTHYHVRP